MLVVLLAGVAALGLAGCGGGGSSKSSPTTTACPTRPAGSTQSLAAYLGCLGDHGVNVKKVAAAKKSGGAGAALKKDPHFKAASPLCRHFLS